MSALGMAGTAASADFGRLAPGFADPVKGAQACFRVILDVLSHPGRIGELPPVLAGSPPAPLEAAAAAIALTLCDMDTPVWFDEAAAAAAGYLAFHCGARVSETLADARFAFVADAATLPPLDAFALGSDEYPERSATLVIAVAGLTSGSGTTLRGPGIREEARLGVAGLPARFWAERAALAELFPRGPDVLFVSGGRLAALPRSTRVIL
jgi:alpha-D-ribose 1-methylphosphonate 5-triphosphate synthase subunit PhnH